MVTEPWIVFLCAVVGTRQEQPALDREPRVTNPDASSRSGLPPIVARHCTEAWLPTSSPVSDRVAAITAVRVFPALTVFGARNAAMASLSGSGLTSW